MNLQPWTPLVGLAALLTLGPSSRLDPEALLREGNAAFARGDYATAAALYEQAEARSTEPSLVAFNLAAAKYHQALAAGGDMAALREAEQLYRCCLDTSDPRRPLALYGLGNCLLQRGADRDRTSLLAAIECYQRCLADPHTDANLVTDARHNRERAKLLLLQLQASAASREEKTPADDSDANPNRPDRPAMPMPTPVGDPGGEGKEDPRTGATQVKPEPGQAPRKSNEPPPPGAGNLPPVPDQAELAPLSPQDAAAHLEQAARRIHDERQTYRRGRARGPAKGVPDW
jgi:tetratricopeptide (TPR) repeat protein